MKITRRDAIRIAAAAAAFEPQGVAQQAGGVPIHWLDKTAPGTETGVSWGVPWARGTVRREQKFALTSADGKSLPLQQWPLAYWPDGSIKFSGFATVTGDAGPFRLAPGVPAAGSLKVETTGRGIEIDTGKLQCRVGPTSLIDAMTIDGRVVARDGKLVCNLDNGAEFTSSIKKVTVEQNGPVRAVVKIEGVHKNDGARNGCRSWCASTSTAGLTAVRLVHTIVFDGDHEKDFIKGLGLAFAVPMREQVHNRHVRFSGEGDGLWSEPVQPLTGRRRLPGASIREPTRRQAHRRITRRSTPRGRSSSPIGRCGTISSSCRPRPTASRSRSAPIRKAAGWTQSPDAASSGLVFAGDVSGGLAVGVKNFWQSYPASLEVRHATAPAAELRVWLWSPEAPAMDLRHYDTRAHDLDSSYEDVQPGFSTPHGVARTSEMTLFPTGAVPAKAETAVHAKLAQQPPLLMAAPEHLHSTKVFGIWSLPDRSTAAKKSLEDQLDAAFDFYHKEVEQRHWYGFWNYGDVMHQHDGARHEWRYDIGGFAWDNTELGTDMWLWYTFLRTGRADVFRMAEAMTRHTSEVDTYHLGRFAMLGSRHNVRHWGCGAKEARISQAAYRRFHYYLTTDERTGDLMREVVDADYKATEIDPMRLASPLTKPLPYPGRVRGGPDWLAFAGNWMTEWERTGDTKYRDKIVAGMDSIAAMPFGFLTGPDQLYGYDPKTGKLYALRRAGGHVQPGHHHGRRRSSVRAEHADRPRRLEEGVGPILPPAHGAARRDRARQGDRHRGRGRAVRASRAGSRHISTR